MAYMDAKQYDKALEYAKKDYDIRPDSVNTNFDGMDSYKKGDYKSAMVYSDKVFTTKIKNADMLYKASLINSKAGNSAKAEELKKEALAISEIYHPKIMVN